MYCVISISLLLSGHFPALSLTLGDHLIYPPPSTGLATCEDKKRVEITMQNEVEYLFYRILVEAVPGRQNGEKFVVLRDVKMYGKKPTGKPYKGTPNYTVLHTAYTSLCFLFPF